MQIQALSGPQDYQQLANVLKSADPVLVQAGQAGQIFVHLQQLDPALHSYGVLHLL